MQDNDQKGETIYSGEPVANETVYSEQTQYSEPIMEHQTDTITDDEGILISWYQKIGYALILGFIFPIYFSSPFGSKLYFPNISLLGKGGFLADFTLLYPLLAGISILIVIKKQAALKRGLIILSIGILPVLIMHILNKDIISAMARGGFNATLMIQLLMLSVIGMFIGAKSTVRFDTQSGRLIGGISSVAFLILILLPIESRVPIFFSLFKMLKFPGFMKLIIILMIGVCVALMYAALLGIINFKRDRNTLMMAEKSKKIIFFSVLVVPTVLVLQVFFTDSNSSFTVLLKFLLLIGGQIGLIAHSMWDVVAHTQPVTMKGSDLLK